MTRILVEFRAEDADAAKIITAMSQFPPYSVERAEMEGHLFMVLARVSWRQADQLRASQRRRENRKRKT